jgi:hypothetical protein
MIRSGRRGDRRYKRPKGRREYMGNKRRVEWEEGEAARGGTHGGLTRW